MAARNPLPSSCLMSRVLWPEKTVCPPSLLLLPTFSLSPHLSHLSSCPPISPLSLAFLLQLSLLIQAGI